jgi:hypothetical protein
VTTFASVRFLLKIIFTWNENFYELQIKNENQKFKFIVEIV